jgi:hypothetical protein
MGTAVKDDYVADTDLLKNPERGMYYLKPLEDDDDYDTSWIVAEWLWLAPVCHDNLVWDPTNQTTSPVLKEYAKKLDEARSNGYKILFRPRYDDENDEGEVSDDCKINGVPVFHADSRECQFNHIEAVAAMLGDYKDVIAFIQAGYLGNWGEWNTDGYTKENAPLLYNRTDRCEILDHILFAYAAAGIAQDVELRRPVFAKEVVERWENPENSDIYGEDASANVGLHNDCFMSSTVLPNSSSDGGTYSNFFDFVDGSEQNLSKELGLATVEDARKWAEDWTEHSSFGGETCPNKEHPGDERWRFCNNMTGDPGEPAKLHLCYLNAERSNTVSEWTAQGCYNDIRRNLGYRFEVTCVEYTKTVSAGDTFSVTVDVENNGWARLHKPRDAKLVLRNGATPPLDPYTFSGGPVSNWAPGTTTRISVSDSAPPPGTYSVWLWIPDPDAPSRIPYAVKLATLRDDGKNVFDQTTGENDLGVEIEVQ